jgi:predicted phosphodiesterase
MRVGVLSDTHNLLRPRVLELLAGCWPAESRLVVYGHSHRPELSWHGSCLLLNPGQSVALLRRPRLGQPRDYIAICVF